MNLDSKIYVAGHNGLVGSAIVRELQSLGYNNIITSGRSEYDLRKKYSVFCLFDRYKPDYVFLAAAKVGGIHANATKPAEFIYDNLMIQSNIIETAREYDVKKLMFLGSSCIYPKHSVVPISEWQLMTGPLEPTNDAYAIAKIAGIKMCQAYKQQYGFNAISLMPTNLYGPNDNFDDTTSHVLPALINRFHLATIRNEKEVICWGDGRPMREFLYVDDLAKACIFLMNEYNDSEIINVGTGIDVTVKQLAETIASVVGYKGEIIWDTSKPNGTMRKVLNVEKINKLGWKSETSLRDGIRKTYRWYLDDINQKSSITL